MLQKILLVVLFGIIKTEVIGEKCGYLGRETPEQCASTIPNFYVFTQHYPATFCAVHNSPLPSCKCNSTITKDAALWAIHGLWPSSYETNKCPSFCTYFTDFNMSAIQVLKPKLDIYWPDLCQITKQQSGFWEHEFCKHGTCCKQQPWFTDTASYFKKALNLAVVFNITRILSTQAIVPSSIKMYSANTVLEVIQRGVKNKRALMFCAIKWDAAANTMKQWLYEVRICTDLQFNLINCPSSTYSSPSYYSDSDEGMELCELPRDLVYCPVLSTDHYCHW